MSAFAHVEPPPPAVGIWFCGTCLRWQEFDTDVESERLGGRAGTADCPLYCTACQTRIDERHEVLHRDPEPPRITRTFRMSLADRAAGIERLRLARLRFVAPDDPEPEPAPATDDDLALQLRQLGAQRHGALGQ